MNRTRMSCWKLTLGLLTILAMGLPGCGTTRQPQEQGYLLEQRRADSEGVVNLLHVNGSSAPSVLSPWLPTRYTLEAIAYVFLMCIGGMPSVC